MNFEQAAAEAKAEAAAANGEQKVAKVENGRPRESEQVLEFKRTGP